MTLLRTAISSSSTCLGSSSSINSSNNSANSTLGTSLTSTGTSVTLAPILKNADDEFIVQTVDAMMNSMSASDLIELQRLLVEKEKQLKQDDEKPYVKKIK
ncbi:MAG: hypothetical protein HFH31_02510 [Bacilli bacterium]|nr:hypothetical protein [Bacilli bacterium]